ncbi:Cleavage stimulation factor subunit 2 hinge domain-containing protein [Dioscorea alata]|uniref:Cleavage stimulation factor subunit 2 hinge domain-containing protein n=1 Tax=Dioscorea alata TaxID=55571 RepID=A0ACB7UDT3_DIOAL|nr:Cleavage stimulation factor subunit 2 hinge domain-containing protein [Dioscorea alata]
MSEEKFPRETRAASMASQPSPGDNVREMFLQLLQVTSQLKVLMDQNPQEANETFRAFPELARTFLRAMLMLICVGLPPYLPVETNDQAVAAYSPQLPQPPLSPPASATLVAPPLIQPSSAPAAEPVFDAGNDLGESLEEQPPPPSQTPPKSTRQV